MLASAAVLLLVLLLLLLLMLAVRRGQRRGLLLLLLVVVVEQVHLAGGVGRGQGAMVTVVVVTGEMGVHWKEMDIIKYQELTNMAFFANSPGFCRCARFPLGGGGGGGGPSSSSSSSSCRKRSKSEIVAI